MASGANKLIFKNSEKARDEITVKQKREISKLYESWAKDLETTAKRYKSRSTLSEEVTNKQIAGLKRSLESHSRAITEEIEKKIKQNIYIVSDALVKDNVEWLKNIGLNGRAIDMAFSSVPDQIVRLLVTGQIYESGWSLSGKVWGNNQKVLANCYQIVAKGVAQNRPIYEIAKDLEAYVNPKVKKPWNPMIKMMNTKTGQWEYASIYRGKVDYNAQRLARTLVQHGYQQSFIAVTKNNPFVLKYQWSANGSRACPICMDRDGQTYSKDNLPMDHPNGQCTMIPVIDDNLIDRLADWYNSPDGTYPEIDRFAKEIGYKS